MYHSRLPLTAFPLMAFASLVFCQSRSGSLNPILPDSTVISGNIRLMLWEHPRMVIVKVPDTLVFIYYPHNDASLDSVALRQGLRCLINGSFFDGVRGNATHAGWLSLYGRRVTPLMDNRQLTHMAQLNGTNRSIEFIATPAFTQSADSHMVQFQTGPLVVENGSVREDLIRGSINGSTYHTRTLLATMDRRQCFFITVTERVSLIDLAAMLPRLSIFQNGRLDVLNLDGGSSVALYLRGMSGFNYNDGDKLPILIGFH